MLEYFNENPESFWFAVGALALVIELMVLGMSTIILFMLGLGAIATGTLIYTGIIGDGWLLGTAVTGIIAFVAGVLLWKPLKRYQEADAPSSGESSILSAWNLTFRLCSTRRTRRRTNFQVLHGG